MIFEFYIHFQIFHFTLVNSHTKIFLSKKPFHEFRKDLRFVTFCFQICRKSFRSSEIFFLFNNLVFELRSISVILFTNFFKFEFIQTFLYHLDSFLADVKAGILSIRTFENWFGRFILSFCIWFSNPILSLLWAFLKRISKMGLRILIERIILMWRIY